MTPEQINKIREADKLPPVQNITGANSIDRSSELKAAWDESPIPKTGGLEQKIRESVKDRFSKASQTIKGATPESQGEPAVTRGVQATAETFGVIPDTAKAVLDTVAPNRKEKYDEAKTKADANLEKMGIKPHEAKKLSDTYNAFVEKANEKGKKTGIQVIADYLNQHPEQSKHVDTVLKTLGATGEIAGDILVADLGVGATKKAGGVVKIVTQDFIAKPSAKNTTKSLTSLEEKISPKLTSKETRLAQSQGRLVKGKKATFFKSGTEDKVLPSKQVQRAAETINKKIPGASKMDEPTLQTALDKKTSEIAKKLQPEMKKVPLKPKTVQKINDDLAKLKEKQIADAPASEEANVMKRQVKFEKFLMKSGNKNMDDLWQTAKNYDASIPENVKKANALSSESLQLQRSEWLQNRAILRDAITDSSTTLGKKSQKVFSDMHDMYNAQENLLSKAIVEKVGEESGLKKVLKHPLIKYGVPGVVGVEGIRSIIGD